MKRAVILFSICLATWSKVYSQDISHKIGEISIWEVELKSYEKDPDAEALVLFDVGDTYFFEQDGGYDIRFTRTKRIKILGQSGIDFAEVSIPLWVDGYGKTERIISLEAFTYNYDDKNGLMATSVDPNSIFKERISENIIVHKFTFPNVKVGSIVEYKVVVETPFLFNMPNWEFQDYIPTLYSEYVARIIPFYEYIFYAQGVSKFDIQEQTKGEDDRQFGSVAKTYGQNVGGGMEFNDIIFRFGLNDVPAFKDEGYMTSANDYIIKIIFQLSRVHQLNGTTQEIITTWPKMKEDMLKQEHFGKYLKVAKKAATKELPEVAIPDGADGLERAQAIIDHVKNRYVWNKLNSKYTNQTVREFQRTKEGNAAEVNLYLIAMLRSAGIKVDPVILSTRQHGKVKSDYPFKSFFNYVIGRAVIDDQVILIDGTEPVLPFSRLPIRCLNDIGIVIDELDEVRSIELQQFNKKASTIHYTLAMRLAEDLNTMDVKAQTRLTEMDAFIYRSQFQDSEQKLKDYFNKKGYREVSKVSSKNYDNKIKPYIITTEGNSAVERIDDMVVIKPFLNFPLQENKLKQKKRNYPVDLVYPQIKAFQSTIEIPHGYAVTDLPENTETENSLIRIMTHYAIVQDKIIAKADFFMKKAIYNPKEYARIKFYLDTQVRDFNRDIVLKPIVEGN